MRLVVSDTGPILHLYEAGALDLMGCFPEVHIPPAVARELAEAIPDWLSEEPTWLVVTHLTPSFVEEAREWEATGILGPGEAEAIALARQLHADWFLTDDSAARLFAEVAGLEAHGSLGVVLWAGAVGHLTYAEANGMLKRLAQTSLWVSASVLGEAHTALDELFR
ncbi:MAG: hypothetical protein FJ291_24965 [Planctomycetes bacterium]|nr:hypothetical protein [Planctomycetota bacterium]